jgi:hypothetical protein
LHTAFGHALRETPAEAAKVQRAVILRKEPTPRPEWDALVDDLEGAFS